MSRLLFLAAVVVVVYWLFRSYRGHLPPNDSDKGAAEDMVQCAYCGVHLPKGESIEVDGRYYCSDAHRQMADVRRH